MENIAKIMKNCCGDDVRRLYLGSDVKMTIKSCREEFMKFLSEGEYVNGRFVKL